MMGEFGMDAVALWRRAIKLVLFGLAFSLINLEIFYLNYIFTIIGAILMVLGFRTVKKENRYFKVCWIIIFVRILCFALRCGLEATIWQSSSQVQDVLFAINVVQIFLLLFTILFFGNGLHIVQRKDFVWKKGVIAVSFVCYVIGYLLSLPFEGFVQEFGWSYIIVVVIVDIVVFRYLYKLYMQLKVVDESIDSERINVSYIILATVIVCVMLLSIGSGYLFFNKYPMKWKTVEASGESEIIEVKEELLLLGFPENILEDLTIEDLLECKGAVDIEINQKLYAMNDGHLVPKKTDGYLFYETVTDVFELQLTSIAVKLSADGLSWKIIHHFEWVEDIVFIGTEAIEFDIAGELQREVMCSGQVLYDEGERTYASSYYSLGSQPKEQNMFAAFSFPKEKERCRGYVSYKLLEWRENINLSSGMLYRHQHSWLQYPVQTALDYAKETYNFSKRIFYPEVHRIDFKTGW